MSMMGSCQCVCQPSEGKTDAIELKLALESTPSEMRESIVGSPRIKAGKPLVMM
jgi:hypothetical protein